MKNKSPVIEPIKAELKRQGYTYESFAELFGKTEGWFGFLMTGQRRITVDLLYEIAPELLPYSNHPVAASLQLSKGFRLAGRCHTDLPGMSR